MTAILLAYFLFTLAVLETKFWQHTIWARVSVNPLTHCNFSLAQKHVSLPKKLSAMIHKPLHFLGI